MSIAIRANQSGVDQAAAQKAAEKKGHQDVVKSVNAGGFLRKNDTQSQIEARRNNAKKQALKVVSDAWKSDNKSADSIADMEGLKQSKVSEMNEIRAKMKDIENTKKSLQEEYGVADGSQEQKDLELLEKYQNNMNGSSYDQFSDEELSRLKELQNAPLTEYQKKVLNLNRDMEKASDAADEIMDSANKEILGMLIEEGKNNADEKVEEEKEKAEEAADKKEEQDKQIEEAQEKRKNQEEIIEGQQNADQLEQDVSMQKQNTSKMDEAQKNIQKILKEKNLVNEDLKGIEIDLNF